MQNLDGKRVVVTGAGSGIGRALALTCAAAGMDVAVADIDIGAAEAAASDVRTLGRVAIAARCDVADRAQVEQLAERVYAELGVVHLLCNNAGVNVSKPAQMLTDADWNWVLGVNLFGVIHGIQAFLPRLIASGEPAHILNTASIAGLVPDAAPRLAPYSTSKYAVVGLSEALRLELAPLGIGVSVLCPGPVATQLSSSGRNRPQRFGGEVASSTPASGASTTGGASTSLAVGSVPLLDPMQVAARALEGVRSNALYVITHPEYRNQEVARRFDAILEAFDHALD